MINQYMGVASHLLSQVVYGCFIFFVQLCGCFWCSLGAKIPDHHCITLLHKCRKKTIFLDLGEMIMFYVIVMSLYDYMPIFCWCLWCIVSTYIYHTRIVWDSDSPPIYLRNGAPSSPRIRTWMPGATTRRSAGHSLRRVVMGPGCGVSCFCLFCEKCLLSGTLPETNVAPENGPPQ